ncbi:hypothetical protein D3C87_325130 [compost metagenome]
MLNRSAFFALLASDDKQQCYTEARRYGNIQIDSSYDIDDGAHAGAHRIITIEHHGVALMFHMHNGNVLSLSILNWFEL